MKTFEEREKERAEANVSAQVAAIQRESRESARASDLGQDIMHFASRKGIIVEVVTGKSLVTLMREKRKLVITVREDASGELSYDLKPQSDGAGSGFNIQGFLTSITGSRPHDAMLDAVMDWLQK